MASQVTASSLLNAMKKAILFHHSSDNNEHNPVYKRAYNFKHYRPGIFISGHISVIFSLHQSLLGIGKYCAQAQ